MHPESPVLQVEGRTLPQTIFRKNPRDQSREPVLDLPAMKIYGGRCTVSRWVLDTLDQQKIRETRTIFFYKWTDEPQPSELSLSFFDLDREPIPRVWRHRELKNGVIVCEWQMRDEEIERLLNQGSLFMAVWNCGQPLMKTALWAIDTSLVSESLRRRT